MTRTSGSKNLVVVSASRKAVARGRGRSRARRGVLPLVATSAGTLVGVVIVTLGLLYIRLMYGPLALDFLVRPIESAIAEELAGPTVRIEGVALGLNAKGLFQFELKNVKVSDAGGEPLVAAPSVAVSLSRRAMLAGRIALESLDLVSPRLVLFYADDGTLSLKFSPVAAARDPKLPPPPFVPVPAEGTPPQAASADADGMLLGRIDLVKVLAEASARARRGDNAGAYLREIGLRSATVIIDNGRGETVWRVPELDLDLDHRRTRSSVAGRAKIESVAGPWELTFRSYQHIKAKALNLSLSVQGLVPRGLVSAFPHLSALEGLDLPISGDARLELSSAGEILAGKIAVEAAAGNLGLPGPAPAAMRVAGGRVELTYSAAARSFEIGPSFLSWGDGNVKFTGNITHTAQGVDGPRWNFEVTSTEGWVGGDGTRPLPIDRLTASGDLTPEHGRVALRRLVVQAGGTELSAQGEMVDAGGGVQARLEGKIGAMPLSVFRTLWPAWLAPATRSWASRHLTRGDVEGGTFELVRGGTPPTTGWTPVSDRERLALTLEGTSLELDLIDGEPAIEVPRALLRIDGQTVELSIPEASAAVADGRRFALKGTFSVDLGQPLPRTGTLALWGLGPLSLVIEMLDRQAPHVLRDSGIALAGSDGKVDGSLNISLPLSPQPKLQDARVEGRLRVSDAKIGQAFGALDVQGINVTVDVSAGALEAKGKFLAGNVPATVGWQYIYGAPADKQPPLRIAAVLYENERAELGLDLDDIVHGEVGAEITVTQDAQGGRHVHVRADLTNAELRLEGLAWHKPVGKRGVFEFDIIKGTKYPVELHNVRLDGENVAIGGWIGAGQDFRAREYRFPHFSLNVVSNFEANGKLRPDNVWEVTAKGATYDGKDLFRSFFFNPAAEKPDKRRPGLDLRAEFDTVLGSFDTSLRAVRVSMQRRAGKLTYLDARGTLVEARGTPTSNKQLEAGLRSEPGRPRVLVAKSNDAGHAFRLVGFLPHMVGGDMNLEVNLDGRGAIEREGLLSATRFHLLGNEVGQEPFPGAEPAGRRRNIVREKVPFDHLRIPFSVGRGHFVLKGARLEGPVASATGSGTIDFRTKRLHVAGTFTPVAGLNQIFRDIPLFGDIVTGPKREGVFAWNYALKGGLENPEIVFNPLSGVAPGFTREFFPIVPEEPRAAPRRGPSGRLEPGARASSSPATGPGVGDGVSPTAPDVSEGWSSENDNAATKKK